MCATIGRSAVRVPHEGHELFALIARIVTTALSPSLNTPTAQNPAGSNFEARKDGRP